MLQAIASNLNVQLQVNRELNTCNVCAGLKKQKDFIFTIIYTPTILRGTEGGGRKRPEMLQYKVATHSPILTIAGGRKTTVKVLGRHKTLKKRHLHS